MPSHLDPDRRGLAGRPSGMFNHLDGVVAKLVPDNLKTGITHASFYYPVVNRSYHELARHYGTGVVPTRVRRPRDKASAEKGVQVVETRIWRLRNRAFFTLDEANAAIRELLAAVNAPAADDRQDADPANAVRGPGEPPPRCRCRPALRNWNSLVLLQAPSSRQRRGRGRPAMLNEVHEQHQNHCLAFAGPATAT